MSPTDTMGNGNGEPLLARASDVGVSSGAGVANPTSAEQNVAGIAVAVSGKVIPAMEGPSIAKGAPAKRKPGSDPPSRVIASSSKGPGKVSDSAPDSGTEGAAGGGDGGDGRHKPDSGEFKLEILRPGQEVLDVVKELAEGGYARISAVELFDHHKAQAEFRRQFWDRDIQEDIYRLQQSESTKKADTPEDWYGLRKYRGGRIMIENAAQVLGSANVFDMLYDEDGNPKRILEIGPGNGDLIRGIQKAKEKMSAHAEQLRSLSEKRENGRRTVSVGRLRTEIRELARNVDLNSIDPTLVAIDFVPGFCRSLQKLSIAAIPGNICDEPDKIIGKHTLEKSGTEIELAPHSIDEFIMNFVGDRVEDIEKAIANIRRLAKKAEGNKRSRFMMGGSFPFSSISDSDSKSPNIPAVKFWDQTKDMRELWTGDANDPDARKQAVVNAVLDLARSGLVVDRIAIQPTYEAYSPHCIIEKPEDLVAKDTLEELLEKYQGTDYEQVIRDVFNGKSSNKNDLIALPQIYKHVYLFGGYVRPWDDEMDEVA